MLRRCLLHYVSLALVWGIYNPPTGTWSCLCGPPSSHACIGLQYGGDHDSRDCNDLYRQLCQLTCASVDLATGYNAELHCSQKFCPS